MGRLPVEERRKQIVEAAIAVMSQRGVADTTTRQIARQAGVPLSAIHYCFGGKEALTGAVLERIVEKIDATASHGLSSADTLGEAIAMMTHSFWAFVEADAGLQTMQYELTLGALRSAAGSDFARRQYVAYVAIAESLFEEVTERSGERCAVPLPDLARFLVAGLDGLILQHLTDPDAERSRAGVELLISGARALAEGTTSARARALAEGTA